jgi:hypothetical protein
MGIGNVNVCLHNMGVDVGRDTGVVKCMCMCMHLCPCLLRYLCLAVGATSGVKTPS